MNYQYWTVIMLIMVPGLVQPAWADKALENTRSADIVVDGTHTTVSIVNSTPFGLVWVKNRGTLEVDGEVLRAKTVKVEADSTIDTGRFSGGTIIEWQPKEKTASGGTHVGRGGGPDAIDPIVIPAHATENFLRRVDVLLGGGNGASAPDLDFDCPEWPFRRITARGGRGGQAGAALRIEADYMEIDGTVSANGEKGQAHEGNDSTTCWFCIRNFCDTNAGGGGSGGTLILIAKNLVVGASAALQANGGDGGVPANELFILGSGYAGGGGRVKIYYEKGSISPLARIEAKAGRDPHTAEEIYGFWAEDGTTYIKQVSKISSLFAPSGDINNDGIVDRKDLFYILDQWGNAETTLSPTPTPTYPGGITPTPVLPTPTFTPQAKPAME